MEKKRFKRMLEVMGMFILAGILVQGKAAWATPAAAAGNIDDSRDYEEGKPEAEGDSEEPEMEEPILVAASRTDGNIQLSWDEIDGGEEYVLSRSSKKHSGFRRIYATDGERCRYTDRKRVPGRAYYYRLTVYSQGRARHSRSETVKGRALKKVRIVKISNVSGSRKLVLHWKAVKGADSYQVLRKNESKNRYQVIATVKGTKTSYADTRRRGGRYYTYRVRARDDAGGRGGESKAVSQMAIDRKKRMIALTYDDGPSMYTPAVLKALKKYRAHATFFVVGSNVGRYPASLRREVALGCEIGNHTYSHNNLTRLSSGQIQSVLDKTNRAVKGRTGKNVRIMRPPGGNINPSVCRAVGMPVILWSVDTLDWKTRSTSATIQCVLRRAQDGSVVLMHDLHKPTARAADTIIRTLKGRGYQLVTVSELAAYRGGMSAGRTYSRFRRRK